MKRAIFSLAALVALSLAACGGGDDNAAPGGQTPGSTPGQAQPADPSAPAPSATGAVPPAEGAPAGTGTGTVATEDPMTPTGGYGGGEKMKYEVCMTQARQAGGDVGKQIEQACSRLPDATK